MPGSINSGFKWDGKKFKKALQTGLSKNLRAAGAVVVAEAKQALNISGGYKRIAKSKRKSNAAKDGYSSRGSNPSKPGEPPHYKTKNIRRGMFAKLVNKNTVVRVGTTAPEGPLQEFGTRKQAPRPFLSYSLNKKGAEVASALTQPVQT